MSIPHLYRAFASQIGAWATMRSFRRRQGRRRCSPFRTTGSARSAPQNRHAACTSRPIRSKSAAPVMAVRWRSYLVKGAWVGPVCWAGQACCVPPARCSPRPDPLEGGANHRFALWVPTVSRAGRDENTQQAREAVPIAQRRNRCAARSLGVRTRCGRSSGNGTVPGSGWRCRPPAP